MDLIIERPENMDFDEYKEHRKQQQKMVRDHLNVTIKNESNAGLNLADRRKLKKAKMKNR